LDESHPENLLTYFPTDEEWTMHTRPRRIEPSERYPTKYAVADLPSTASRERNQTTRRTEGKSKGSQYKRKQTFEGKGSMDNFVKKTQNKERASARELSEQEMEEIYDAISEEEINQQLNTGFSLNPDWNDE
jgi:hypothetical protein